LLTSITLPSVVFVRVHLARDRFFRGPWKVPCLPVALPSTGLGLSIERFS
jgi:hypothetical protein